MSYQNPKLYRIITNARFAESGSIHDGAVRDMIQKLDHQQLSEA